MKKLLIFNFCVALFLAIAVMWSVSVNSLSAPVVSPLLAGSYAGSSFIIMIMSFSSIFSGMTVRQENVVKRIFVVVFDILFIATILTAIDDFTDMGVWPGILLAFLNALGLLYYVIKVRNKSQ